MARCFRCEREAKEVKLNDALYKNDLVKVCERCAITENLPVLRRPSTSQLKAAERSFGVYERLKRLSGTNQNEKSQKSMLEEIKKLDEHPELERVDYGRPTNLIRNFHWFVMRARRDKGISIGRLAEAIGESEAALRMVERGLLPGDSDKLIRKIEQFFGIRIREVDEEEQMRERKKKEKKKEEDAKLAENEPEQTNPILDDGINDQDLLEVKQGEIKDEKEMRPARVLKFNPELKDNITILDLKRIKEEKEAQESRELRKKEERLKEMKDKVAEEMKNAARGQEKETIEEKRAMLNRAIQIIGDKKETKVPSIQELFEKKKDKEKVVLEKEKLRIRILEKKSEQEQIKQLLRGETQESARKSEKKQEKKEEEMEIVERKTENRDFQKISELAKDTQESNGLLGEEIEVVEDE